MNNKTNLTFINRSYYFLKPYLSSSLIYSIRKKYIYTKKLFIHSQWPIYYKSNGAPVNWTGWPGGKKFALALTHDVESQTGHDRIINLAKLEMEYGFRSAFYFVPEKYLVSEDTRNFLTENGFEVGVHGLNHDGKLYFSKSIFDERAAKINMYLKDWHAVGFRSPAMHHNLQWICALNIEYDASTFDTDPFEPQSDGMHTIFPFYVRCDSNDKKYIELPYTIPQDSTLYIYLGEKNICIWQKKMDWIVKNGGMAMVITHPDYMNFIGNESGFLEYPVKYYQLFLNYIVENYKDMYWLALPKEIAKFWKENIFQ
jgi:hypothetical protein